MLDVMRQNAKSLHVFFWLIIIAFIGAPVFTALKGSVGKTSDPNAAAWVNGKPVSFSTLQQQYQQMYNMYRQLYGDNLSADILQKLDLEGAALTQVIRKALLVQGAQEYNIRVSEAELVKAIQAISSFQTDGRFDPAVYQRLLTGARLTPQQFEAEMTDELLADKVEQMIKHTVQVTDAEIRAEFLAENEKVKVEGLLVKPEQFLTAVEVKEDEVKSYYDAHKEAFTTPPRVKVNYIVFDPQQLKAEITVSEDDIKAYYTEHESEYNKGKEVKARHILIRAAQDADTATDMAARHLAEEVRQMIADGKDFAELAKTYSEDPGSKENGGDLGFFSKGMMAPEFETAAFALEPGKVSDPVRTQFGYHLIKVDETREETDPYGKAKPAIEDLLKLQQAQTLAAGRAEERFQQILEKKDFAQVAKDAGLEVNVSPLFAQGDTLDETATAVQQPQIQEAAFALTAEEPFSQPIETPSGYYLLQFVERKEPYIPELTEVSAQVMEAVRKEKAKEQAKAAAQKIVDDLKAGTTWESVVTQGTVEKFTPEPFNRRQRYISEVGTTAEQLVKTAFALNVQETSPVLDLTDKFGIIRLVEKIAIDEEQLKKEKTTLQDRLLWQKQDRVFQEFIEGLKQKADIQVAKQLEQYNTK